jgi:hypothetical protein
MSEKYIETQPGAPGFDGAEAFEHYLRTGELSEREARLDRSNEMDKDRTAICKIISKMLDNPDEVGIYPTSTAYTELEHYIEGVRAEAIGWMHADACAMLDRGDDPRVAGVPDIYLRAITDLAT